MSLTIFQIGHNNNTKCLLIYIFSVVMELSENFTVERNRKCRSMISTIRLVENNNLEACYSILQIGDYLGRNRR